jgi:uncharacterized protein (TIGR01244 family)
MMMRLAFALLCASWLAVPVAAQVEKKDVAGIRNYSRVDATVGCGGAVDPAAMATLKKEGFISVINLRLPTEEGANVEAGRAAAQSAGLKYIHLPFNVAAPDSKVVDSFLAAVADKGNQPVFIHCGSASRVGGMWMIKRVLQDKWMLDRALAEAKAIGLNNAQLEAFAVQYIKNHQ